MDIIHDRNIPWHSFDFYVSRLQCKIINSSQGEIKNHAIHTVWWAIGDAPKLILSIQRRNVRKCTNTPTICKQSYANVNIVVIKLKRQMIVAVSITMQNVRESYTIISAYMFTHRTPLCANGTNGMQTWAEKSVCTIKMVAFFLLCTNILSIERKATIHEQNSNFTMHAHNKTSETQMEMKVGVCVCNSNEEGTIMICIFCHYFVLHLQWLGRRVRVNLTFLFFSFIFFFCRKSKTNRDKFVLNVHSLH